jgi:hypothetical protein
MYLLVGIDGSRLAEAGEEVSMYTINGALEDHRGIDLACLFFVQSHH